MHRGGRGSGRQPLNKLQMSFCYILFIPICITIAYWIAIGLLLATNAIIAIELHIHLIN